MILVSRVERLHQACQPKLPQNIEWVCKILRHVASSRAVFRGGGGMIGGNMALQRGRGGGCAPSCVEHGAETTSILQSEWEAKKRSIATIICTCSCCVALALSTEKKIFSSGQGPICPPPPPPPPKYGPEFSQYGVWKDFL